MKTAKELFFNYKAMYLRYVTGSTTEWLWRRPVQNVCPDTTYVIWIISPSWVPQDRWMCSEMLDRAVW
jgi:hypothetical protein